MLTQEDISPILTWVGRPYTKDGCWKLIRDAYATQGIEVSPSFYDAAQSFVCVHRTGRVITDFVPEPWDVVLIQNDETGMTDGLMFENEFIDHAGLCIGGRDFLHAIEGIGNTIDSINRRLWVPRIVGFMRCLDA